MAKDFTKIKDFRERWCYQQETYFRFIWYSIRSFFSHFPMGYINLLVQIIIVIISIPIFLGHILESWVASTLIIKPTLEDIESIEDQLGKSVVAKAQLRALEEYKEIGKTIFTFLLGVLTTVITLYLTTQVFKSH